MIQSAYSQYFTAWGGRRRIVDVLLSHSPEGLVSCVTRSTLGYRYMAAALAAKMIQSTIQYAVVSIWYRICHVGGTTTHVAGVFFVAPCDSFVFFFVMFAIYIPASARSNTNY